MKKVNFYYLVGLVGMVLSLSSSLLPMASNNSTTTADAIVLNKSCVSCEKDITSFDTSLLLCQNGHYTCLENTCLQEIVNKENLYCYYCSPDTVNKTEGLLVLQEYKIGKAVFEDTTFKPILIGVVQRINSSVHNAMQEINELEKQHNQEIKNKFSGKYVAGALVSGLALGALV